MSGLFAGTSLERPITCERCGLDLAACACPRDRKTGRALDPKDQAVRVRREKRNGKVVTVVVGFAPRSDRTDDLPALLKHFRGTFGTGGTVSRAEGTIELQGDHRDKVIEHLKSLGYPAKAAGG
ncbi:MAG: translation initiation factor [Phycisphaeraceae bacterium]|nr:translation initiation factor [Phycisphaeraceae bacterium]